MIKIDYLQFEEVKNEDLLCAIIVSRYKDKWIFVKHKERSTWEIPAGHREEGEHIKTTACRELYEETGAKEFDLLPVSLYSVTMENNEGDLVTTYGGLYFAEVFKIGELPEFEIEEINFFDGLPNNLTYKKIQTLLFKKVLEYLDSNKKPCL